jgi:hypothetical protein
MSDTYPCAVCHEQFPVEALHAQYGGVSPWYVCAVCVSEYWNPTRKRPEPLIDIVPSLDLYPPEEEPDA